ncbi:hypothetical protein H5410_022297 [Solanum commersonii]|uniref:Uncharacterized protein n=1 Tax=Solanum commersonii TaxID=4109 RepID=A0A9J5ZGR8_SOLCO|nr:hypothetical protein H5410_022297 [Solanum commersonii]
MAMSTISLSKCVLALEKLKLVDESVNVLDQLLQLPGRITQGTPISVKLKGVWWRSFPVNFPYPQLMLASFYKLDQINPRTRPADIRSPFPWRHYFQNTHRLIFVVDRNDNDHVIEARDKLHRVLNEVSTFFFIGRVPQVYITDHYKNFDGVGCGDWVPMHTNLSTSDGLSDEVQALAIINKIVMLEKKKEYATILAFDVKVTRKLRELSDEQGGLV